MAYSIETTKYIDIMKRFCAMHGINLNLTNPSTIQDKLAWLNIYETNPLKTKCADKVLLHDYCQETLGKDICVPILHVYNNIHEIMWDELPNQFVIKCNHGSGMNIIVKDKSQLNINTAQLQLDKWMVDDFTFRNGFEAHYHDIKHKILVEEFIDDGHNSLFDYKFWCFNGVPKLYTINDGNGHGDIMYYKINGEEWNLYQVPVHEEYRQPKCFDQMTELATTLSQPFKFVRVDFYEVEDRVYLGEMTFTPGAFLFKYKKHEDNIEVGNFLKI